MSKPYEPPIIVKVVDDDAIEELQAALAVERSIARKQKLLEIVSVASILGGPFGALLQDSPLPVPAEPTAGDHERLRLAQEKRERKAKRAMELQERKKR